MIYIYSHKTRSTDMLATFFDDGSNLPDVANRRLRHSLSFPADRRLHGPQLKSILQAIHANGFVRVGKAD
jgi:hypothetical protein